MNTNTLNNQDNHMNPFLNFKPILSWIIGWSGWGTALLSLLHLVPIFFGAAGAIISFLIFLKKYREKDLDIAIKKEELKRLQDPNSKIYFSNDEVDDNKHESE